MPKLTRRLSLLLIVLAVLACGKKEQPKPPRLSIHSDKADPASELPKNFHNLPRALQERLIEDQKLRPCRDAQRAKDRALVRPAPPSFKPEAAKRKIRLKLYAAKPTVKINERFRYRLELQNAAAEPLEFSDPFFKTGDVFRGHVSLKVKGPDGQEDRMMPPLLESGTGKIAWNSLPIDGRMSDKEKKEALWYWQKCGEFESSLNVTLAPGETLTTKPDQPPLDAFKTFILDYRFPGAGTYHIKAVYDQYDRPPQRPDEEIVQWEMKKYGYTRERIMREYKRRLNEYQEYYKNDIGQVESNTLAIKVMP